MRKFTLILASLFLVLGSVYAQVEEGKAYYLKIANLEGAYIDTKTAHSDNFSSTIKVTESPVVTYFKANDDGTWLISVNKDCDGGFLTVERWCANPNQSQGDPWSIVESETPGIYYLAQSEYKGDNKDERIYLGRSGGAALNEKLYTDQAVSNAAQIQFEVIENVTDVTYSFTYSGKQMEYTQTTQTAVGGDFPDITVEFPFGVVADKPAGKVTEDNTNQTIELRVETPFTYADSYEKITDWYYVKLKGQHFLYHVDNQDHIALDKTAVDENNKDAYSWAFVGDPFNGYQIVNRSTGKGYVLSSSTTMAGNTGDATHPIMTALPVAEGNNELWMFTASSHQPNGFFAGQKGYAGNRMNNRGSKLAYWSTGADNGSTFTVEARGEVTLAGAGTEASPYLIYNVDDLILFRNSVNAGETTYNAEGVYVALGANIDLAGQDWSVNIGDDCNATFDGIFDGKGFTISNLTSTETAKKADGYICTGLFGAIAGNAVVKNFTIKNVTINAQYVGNNVGAVVGFAWNASGSIEDVTVTGNININASAVTGVGAILGYDYYSPALKVENCEVIGSEGSSIVGGAAYVGGVVGYASSKIAINNNTVENLSITATGSAAAVAGIMLAGSSADGNTVKNVTVTTNGPLWANSAAAVAGTITKGGITVSNTTVENVTANGAEADIVGGILVEKPTVAIAKIEAKAGDKYYTTLEAAMADKDNNDDVELLVEKAITLDDANAYTYTKGAYDVDVEYTRTLIAGIWNPLYIPFDATVLAEEFEVAKFTTAEGTTITLEKLEANEDGDIELSANTAYVVRPIDGNNPLSLSAWGYIYSNEEVSPLSLGEGFSVRGNYNVLTGAKLADTDRVVGSNGNWGVLKSTSTLKPFRLILSVPEDFTPEQSAAISMRVLDNTTGVEETIFDGQETIVIYDLMGRRVETMTEGGIYIVNGKKMIR